MKLTDKYDLTYDFGTKCFDLLDFEDVPEGGSGKIVLTMSKELVLNILLQKLEDNKMIKGEDN